MKKLLLTASLMVGVCGMAWAAPKATVYPEASISWRGVDYASSSFSADISTVTFSTTAYSGALGDDFGFTVFGVQFTTGSCGDFVDVYDSTGANAAQNLKVPTFRFYNVAGSTTGAATGGSALGGVCSGFSGAPYPVALRLKAFFKPNSAQYNSIMLLYYKD